MLQVRPAEESPGHVFGLPSFFHVPDAEPAVAGIEDSVERRALAIVTRAKAAKVQRRREGRAAAAGN